MKIGTAKRVIAVTVLSVIAAFIVGTLIYIHIYDASKPISFLPQFTSASMNEMVSELKPVQQSGRTDVSIPGIAEVVAEYLPTDMQEFDPNHSSGYLICRLADSEIQIDEWYYSRINDVYGLLTGHTDNYSDYLTYYDAEKAKDLPKYRYKLNINVLKDGSLYKLHIFCKEPKYLYEVISQTVLEINQIM